MYTSIMVPVDIEHGDSLEKALKTAADLSVHYDAPACLVGVTTAVPSAVAHNPEEYSRKLDAFAKEQGAKHGVAFTSKVMVSRDPTADLDKTLESAAADVSADLIVMASHVPGITDHFIASKAGHLASHATVSVLVVR